MEFFHKEEEGRSKKEDEENLGLPADGILLGFPSNSSRQMEHKLRKTSAFISFQGGCNRGGRLPFYSLRFDLENLETISNVGIGEDALFSRIHDEFLRLDFIIRCNSTTANFSFKTPIHRKVN